MLSRSNKSFSEIRQYLDTIPVIETHEHYLGIIEPVDNILQFLTENYFSSDFAACALADMVESGWLDIDQAKSVALDWFFHNPNQIFQLGLEI